MSFYMKDEKGHENNNFANTYPEKRNGIDTQLEHSNWDQYKHCQD